MIVYFSIPLDLLWLLSESLLGGGTRYRSVVLAWETDIQN
jgi:hypothetical protein